MVERDVQSDTGTEDGHPFGAAPQVKPAAPLRPGHGDTLGLPLPVLAGVSGEVAGASSLAVLPQYSLAEEKERMKRLDDSVLAGMEALVGPPARRKRKKRRKTRLPRSSPFCCRVSGCRLECMRHLDSFGRQLPDIPLPARCSVPQCGRISLIFS